HGGDRRRTVTQRFSVRLLYVGWHARRPRCQWFAGARLSGGAGHCQGAAGRRTAASVVLEPFLARTRHRLGRSVHVGLSDGSLSLTNNPEHVFEDRTPGVEEHESAASYLSYTVGLALAIVATIASFVVAQSDLLWPPGIPVGLIVLALAQIGIHLV